MLATLAAVLVLSAGQSQGDDVPTHMPELAARPNAKPRLNLYWREAPVPVTKLSPKKFGTPAESYAFDWIVAGFARLDLTKPQATLRFRVYNQNKPKPGDETFGAARLLLRLWETRKIWGDDHRYDYAAGVVDLYLCLGGKPGGEALLDHDSQVPPGLNAKVATIYIYDLPSFRTPVERVREVAHEYGHIVLPPVGGYSAPEDWANGVLGERLFLAQLASDLASGDVPAEDAFEVAPKDLSAWVAKNVIPHRDRAAVEGPFAPRFARRDAVGMDAFVGEATLLQAMFPARRFGRALKLMESQSAESLVKAAALSVEEGGAQLAVPESLRAKAIWIPVGTTTVIGAKVLARRSGWAQVQPEGATIALKTP